MPLEGEYEPSPFQQAAEQVRLYESSGGAEGGTLEGKPPQTFRAGQAFVEMPGERHNFRNASTTEPAKALGFQYAGQAQPLQVNAP